MKRIDEKELKQIFQKIKNGEKSGVEELYEKYHNLIYGIVFSILKNKENSEDVVQDVFAKIINLDSSKFPSQGEASWLYTVTKNETFQFLRKQKQNMDIDDLYSLESDSDEIEDIVDMNSYYKLIENLKPIDKEIISLRILSDITFEKIAQMLNMPIGTVQWRYYKALHSIKLSISSLAALLLVLNLRNITTRFASNVSEDNSNKSNNMYDYKSDLDIKANSTDYASFDSSVSNFQSQSDISGASSSSGRIVSAIANLSILGVSLVLIILTVYFALKTKIKIKKFK